MTPAPLVPVLVAIVLLTVASSASATPRLLPELDSGGGSEELVTTPRPSRLRLVTTRFVAGAAAALVSVPLGLLLGRTLGVTSTSILIAAPSLLLFLALPPVAVTLAEWLAGNWSLPGSSRFRPAIWMALIAHTLIFAGSVYLSGSAYDFRSAALFTGVEMALLPAVVTLVMTLSAPAPEAAAAPAIAPAVDTPRPVQPSTQRAFVLPLVSVAF